VEKAIFSWFEFFSQIPLYSFHSQGGWKVVWREKLLFLYLISTTGNDERHKKPLEILKNSCTLRRDDKTRDSCRLQFSTKSNRKKCVVKKFMKIKQQREISWDLKTCLKFNLNISRSFLGYQQFLSIPNFPRNGSTFNPILTNSWWNAVKDLLWEIKVTLKQQNMDRKENRWKTNYLAFSTWLLFCLRISIHKKQNRMKTTEIHFHFAVCRVCWKDFFFFISIMLQVSYFSIGYWTTFFFFLNSLFFLTLSVFYFISCLLSFYALFTSSFLRPFLSFIERLFWIRKKKFPHSIIAVVINIF
jgi:hypothetical protein